MKIQQSMLRACALILVLLQATINLDAQKRQTLYTSVVPTTPKVALKTNLLYDATSTFNLGVEFKLSSKYTLDLSANYNPWTFSDKKKLKHVLIQPEIRYWLCEPFYGHFFGLHGIYTHYNIANVKVPFNLFTNLEKYRYQGDGYGAGISYGYHWLLSSRWSIEASVGVGYIYFDRKKYLGHKCGKFIDKRGEHYFGPTKLGLSVIYILK